MAKRNSNKKSSKTSSAKKSSDKQPPLKSKKAASEKKTSATTKTMPEPTLKVATIKIDQQVWPLERDVLFRPDRMKYVRKLIKPEGCVFCRAAKEDVSFETLCVHKSEYSMILLNKFPYNSGHLLVLPRRHCGDMLKLSELEFRDLQDTVRLAMKTVNEAYEPGGINIGLNHGAVAGAGIPEHMHYHLVPRWAGDLNFFPLIAETKVLVESLEQTYEKLWGILRKYE